MPKKAKATKEKIITKVVRDDDDIKLMRFLAGKTKHLHGTNYSKMNKKQLFNLLVKVNKMQGGAGFLGDAWKKIKEKVSGVIDKVKDWLFFPPNKLPGNSAKVFERYAKEPITNIEIRRAPLQSGVKKFLDVISFGKLSEKLKEMGYDNVFHLSLYVTLLNGKSLTIEKNERINIAEGYTGPTKDMQVRGVPLTNTQLTLEELLGRAQKQMGDHRFFQYNAKDNNCQDFVLGILRASGLLESGAEEFIKQDAEGIFKSLPDWMSKFSQFVTDTAGKVSQVVSGQGKKKTVRKRKPAKPKKIKTVKPKRRIRKIK